MNALLKKLLAGSPVSEASHPLLVSLLSVAAARPGIGGESTHEAATKKKVLRDWKRVCEAFGACVATGVVDTDLVMSSKDFYGVSYNPQNLLPWGVDGSNPYHYRVYVANALRLVAHRKAAGTAEALRCCPTCGRAF